MSRMTCRNGFVFVAAICTGLMVTSVRGGTLDAPAGLESAGSAMWTLNDIYNVLNTRTTNVTKRASFAEPTGGPTNGTMHTLDEIMTLVTNRSPVRKTGQTNSYLPYDDGWYSTNVGVAWRPSTRFTTNNIAAAGTNVVTDNLTGLMWTRNANLPNGKKDWTNAISYCTNDMNSGVGKYGYTDWRLPNIRELLSLIDYSKSQPSLPAGHPFANVIFAGWFGHRTSTTVVGMTTNAWVMFFWDGGTYNMYNKTNETYVWPVRGP